MSIEEFAKFNNGEILHNDRVHNAKTTSKGFCFFDLKDYNPHEALHFLSGLVSFDVCVVFEVDKSKLKERWGVYAKPAQRTGNFLFDLMDLYNNFDRRFTATEYCTTEYSNRDFKLIRFSENIWDQYDITENQKELKWIEVDKNEQR